MYVFVLVCFLRCFYEENKLKIEVLFLFIQRYFECGFNFRDSKILFYVKNIYFDYSDKWFNL